MATQLPDSNVTAPKEKARQVNIMLHNMRTMKQQNRDLYVAVTRYIESMQDTVAKGKALGESFYKMGVRTSQDGKIGNAFTKMGEAQKSIEKLRETMYVGVKGPVSEQFQATIKQDPSRTPQYVNLDKSWKRTNETMKKLKGKQGSNAAKAGRGKDAAHLADALQRLKEVVAEAGKFNTEMVTKVEQVHDYHYKGLVRTLEAFMEHQYEFYGQSYAVLHELKGNWEDSAVTLEVNDLSAWDADYAQWLKEFEAWEAAQK